MKSRVIINAKRTMTIAEIREKFGMSSQLRVYHTKENGFPKPNNAGEYDTVAVVSWFRSRNRIVEVV